MSQHLEIDTEDRACAWLMIQFPSLSRRVITDVLGAYEDRTATLHDACDAARARLVDACSIA